MEVLAAVLATGPDRLVDDLEEAVEARLVSEVPGRPGSYAFSHALFQGVLYEGYGSNRRASLHARVAQAIESLRPDDPTMLSDLARHYALAAGRYSEKVVHYGAAAGDRALAQLAYEDAIEEYTRALDALPLVTSADEPTKPDLLVRLAGPRLEPGTPPLPSSPSSWRPRPVSGSAQPISSLAPRWATAGPASSVAPSTHSRSSTRPSWVCSSALLQPARRGDETTRVRLLGRLAQALYWSNDKERMLSLSQEALDTARRIGDQRAIAAALHSRHTALWGPDHITEIRAAAEEMLTVGQSLGDRDIQLKAYAWLITDALETDPFEVVDEYIASYASLSEELHRPYLVGYAEAIRAAQAHLEGRFDDMIRLMGVQLAVCEGAYSLRAQEAHRWQMALLLLDLGRVDETLIDNLVDRAARYPRSPFGAMLTLAYATVDRRDEASAELARLSPHDLAFDPQGLHVGRHLDDTLARRVQAGAVETHVRCTTSWRPMPTAAWCGVPGS